MARAVGLLSGGLDSILATRLLLDQHVEVLAVSFVTPFFGCERAQVAARNLGVSFRAVDITDQHLIMVKNPKYGYGRNMNPCIDCHALMLNVAGKIMEHEGFDFLFTGEVLGERPKSQNRQALDIVAKESGFAGLVLRPLSAKLLVPTTPELEGLVDREKLLDIRGRSRKRQMELARAYGITDYPTPAGGCRLTDSGYSRRLRDLLEREGGAGPDDVRLLAVGRHLRLAPDVRFVLGRNEAENEALEKLLRPGDVKLFVRGIPGPTGLLRGEADEPMLRLAASLCARYSDAPAGEKVVVCVMTGPAQRDVEVTPAPTDAANEFLI